MELRDKIRVIDGFPTPDISFKDITTLLKDGPAFKKLVDLFCQSLMGLDIDVIVGPEARGFVFGAPIAVALGIGFVPVRKAGKLPAPVERVSYGLEYGRDILEIHKDAIAPGQRVAVVDDLLATGGTIRAVCDLVERLGGTVAALRFAIALEGLNGENAFREYNILSFIKY